MFNMFFCSAAVNVQIINTREAAMSQACLADLILHDPGEVRRGIPSTKGNPRHHPQTRAHRTAVLG
jgi:hypothetical protein